MLAALPGGREATSSELRNEIPLLEGSIAYGDGKSWGGRVPIGPRVLTTLSAGGQIVRASNNGGWTTSRPCWTSMESWLGHPLETGSDADGLAALVARWLPTFGPGTGTDIKWWIGSTIGSAESPECNRRGRGRSPGRHRVRARRRHRARRSGRAVGRAAPAPDPTTMGWFDRDWYLGPHKAALFDARSNTGHTVWSDGRIVGGWRQDVGVLPRFPSPLSRR